MAQKRKLAAVLFSLGCLQAGSVWGLGLGEMTLESFLNEPLKAKVDLLNTGGLHSDEIRVRLATAEDFDRMGVDRAYFLTGIKFEVSVDSDGRGVILVSSDDPVLEPYLDLIVETRWPSGRLLREYTVLIDPPAFDDSNPVVSASERVYEVEGIPAEPAKKKQDPATTSGTRVDVRDSDLAPGEMPQRDFSSDTSPYPQSGSRYMIKRDETLWNIALAGKPENVSVHQAMLDIQRLNPNAFIDGNINRIKAGYIIYLPTEGDISSDDLSSALAEVNQQNEDWRAGRASESYGGGPKLRISVDEDLDSGSDDSAGESSGDRDSAAGSNTSMEEMDRAALESGDLQGQVDAMSQQVETLERIVSVKDDQIAALQAALEEAQSSAQGAAESAEPVDGDMAAIEEMPIDAVATEPAAQPAAEAEPVAAPKPAPMPTPAPAPKKEESGGLFGNLLYIGGGLLLAILAGLFFWRRKNKDTEVETVASAAAARPQARDAFEGVQLKEQEVELAPADVPAPEKVDGKEEDADTNRGYGEEKYDEYASDAETGDALAEADIYIAYGRYPQAADLLKTAIGSEPGNAEYRLKLLELSLEMGEPGEAEKQLFELQSLGNAEALAKAESLMSGSAEPAVTEAALGETEQPLEADFGELELDDGSADSAADELDLTEDFGSESNGDEMVFAAEGNTMSTKLDLARAYMDMGDEDGARQILDEVAADGDAEQQEEARSLLERLG
ncbi:MAG: FimV/HubP family polar landmark protein [Halieaceae bacterium]